LKIVGEMTPVHEKGDDLQHSGFGSRLLEECESLAQEEGEKLRVISGVGARNYYRKFDYRLEGAYMAKRF